MELQTSENVRTRKVIYFKLAGIGLSAVFFISTQTWMEYLLNGSMLFLHLELLDVMFKEFQNQRNINIWNKNTIFLSMITISELIIAIAIQENILKCMTIITCWVLGFIGIQELKELMECDAIPVREVQNIDNSETCLGYGPGMAFSYHYGYLNLILPFTGDERKGLIENIEDYEATHNRQFGAKKLFILIPSSVYCPPSLTECSNIMKSSESLAWRTMDRGGVKGRPYKNSVYKIWTKQDHAVYVCAEFASPLLTLYEIMNQNTYESRVYKKHQKELVTNFTATLQKIISTNRNCRDLVELIYYEDVDKNGNPLNTDELDVGYLILDRINQGKRKKTKKTLKRYLVYCSLTIMICFCSYKYSSFLRS